MSESLTTLSQLAELVGGHVQGDPATVIHGASVLGQVASGEITFIDKPERLAQLCQSEAAAVVLPSGLHCEEIGAIVVDDVHAAFAKIITYFHPQRQKTLVGVSPQAHIHPSARLGERVEIHPGVTIGEEVEIGEDTTILPGAQILAGCLIGREVTIGPAAVLYEQTKIGDRSMLHGGVVVGANGFGYRQVDGRHVLTSQLGTVQIGSDVEIGAGTTIDRGTYGATTIGDGTKIDNLVQIAHNCQIGRHNMICSQVGIAGSTTTGDYVVMGGQAGVRDHVHLGDGAVLSAMAGITNDVPDGVTMLGIPATPAREQKRKLAAVSKLPEMRKEFKKIRRIVTELEKAILTPQKTDRAA